MTDTKVLLLKADEEPMKGIENPGPHQIYKNPRLSIEKRTLGELKPGNIRVEMLYTGVCGTDVHVSSRSRETGYIRSTAPAVIPQGGRIIGHEGVGKIMEVGSQIKHLSPGMLVTFESIIVCNVCDVCRKGNFNQCLNAKLLGLEEDGLMGTVVDVDASLAHDVTDYIRDEEDLIAAACIEPAGVAYVACQNAQLHGGDTVVVFGGGPIGLLCAVLSKQVFGASQVHLVEPVKFRRDFAARFADAVYTEEEFSQCGPANFDVLIEASGFLKNVRQNFGRVGANGRIVLLARSGEPFEIRNVDHMITNAIGIRGSRGHLCGAFQDILHLQKSKRINLRDIVTSVVCGLDGIKQMLESSDAITSDNCKVVVRLKP